jgi:hypothetical protein
MAVVEEFSPREMTFGTGDANFPRSLKQCYEGMVLLTAESEGRIAIFMRHDGWRSNLLLHASTESRHVKYAGCNLVRWSLPHIWLEAGDNFHTWYGSDSLPSSQRRHPEHVLS